MRFAKRSRLVDNLPSRRCKRPECDHVFKPVRSNQVHCSRECYKKSLREWNLRWRRAHAMSERAEIRKRLTKKLLNKREELTCECGSALFFSSEPITGYSTYGCARCGYLHYTELFVGGSFKYPKMVTPHKRPSYHERKTA